MAKPLINLEPFNINVEMPDKGIADELNQLLELRMDLKKIVRIIQ